MIVPPPVRRAAFHGFLLLSLTAPAASQQMALRVGPDAVGWVPADPSLEPERAFTLECWFRPDAVIPGNPSTHYRFIRKAGFQGEGYLLNWSSWGFPINGEVLLDPYRHLVVDPPPQFDYREEWHHVALTAEVGNALRLYIDGELRDLEPISLLPFRHSGDLTFGGWFFNGIIREEFSGLLDEIRFWKVRRAGDEIRAAMHRRIESGPGLVSIWHMDGDLDDAVGPNHGFALAGARFEPSAAPVGRFFEIDRPAGAWRGDYDRDLIGPFPRMGTTPRVFFGNRPSTRVEWVGPERLRVRVPASDPGSMARVHVWLGDLELESTRDFLYTPRLDGPERVAPGAELSLWATLEPPQDLLFLAGAVGGGGFELPPLAGRLLLSHPWIPLSTFPGVSLDAVALVLPVPRESGLVGSRVDFQVLALEQRVPLVGAFTNVVSVRVE